MHLHLIDEDGNEYLVTVDDYRDQSRVVRMEAGLAVHATIHRVQSTKEKPK